MRSVRTIVSFQPDKEKPAPPGQKGAGFGLGVMRNLANTRGTDRQPQYRPRRSISSIRLTEIRKLLSHRASCLSGASLIAEEERALRAALPSIVDPTARAHGPGLAVEWAALWCPNLLALRGAAWIERLEAGRHLRADPLGRLLSLTTDERTLLRITTIGAVDKNKRQRTADRKEKDRERKRRARAEKGATPRDRSLSASKPWEALGISRRTWERQRARGETGVDAMTQIRPQQDTLIRVSKNSTADVFASTADASGGPLKGSPAPDRPPLGPLSLAVLAAAQRRRPIALALRTQRLERLSLRAA